MYELVLSHHGILGQKWGVRRYQNADGTLTAAGKKRYGAENVYDIDNKKGLQRRLNDLDKAMAKNARDNADAVRRLIRRKNYKDRSLKTKTITEENITKGRMEVEQLLKKNEGKYDIKTRATSRNVSKGSDIVKALLTSTVLAGVTAPLGKMVGGTNGMIAGGTVASMLGATKHLKPALGTKYTVKDKNPKETIHYVDLTKVSDDEVQKWLRKEGDYKDIDDYYTFKNVYRTDLAVHNSKKKNNK